MYEPYDYGDPIDEDGHRVKPRGYPHKEDLVSNAPPRGLKKSSRWVFISRKADIGIIIILLLTGSVGVMWFISQLPVFVETASSHYNWAKDLYATWGTPSMRWLFINLVVGVIVATSGLLSAFGGDSSGQQTDLTAASYDKAVSYRGGDPGVIYGASDPRHQANEARFAGPGYESPLYNPYAGESVKSGRLHHESAFDAWNHGDDDRHIEGDERREGFRDERHRGIHAPREEQRREGFRDEGHRGVHTPRDEPYARPVDPVEVMRAARPVSRQGSQRRGMPMPDVAPQPMPRDMPREVPLSREIPREMPPRESSREMQREVPMSREIPREMPPRESFREIPRDMPPMESFREIPRDMPPMEEEPPSVPREIPVPTEAPVVEESPPSSQPLPNLETVEGISGNGSSSGKEDAIEIISKVYDTLPAPVLEDAGRERGIFHRMKTDPVIHYTDPVNEALADSSPAKPEVLHKSHTFTLGRVIRRDQLVDFIEPLSRKLEGIGRKVRDPHKRSSSESLNQTRESPASIPVLRAAAIEAAAQVEPHRRKLSSESIPVVGHTSRVSSESVPPTEVSIPQIPSFHPEIVKKSSPPPSPMLRQRSIVYPPALLSQASSAVEDPSPPGSPPIEEAIPPPPPPHLKLPSLKDTDSSSITASDELPSFKFYTSASPEPSPGGKSPKKPAETFSFSEDKKPPLSKHSRTPSNIPSSSTQSTGTLEAGSSGDRSLVVKPGKSIAGDEKVADVKEESGLDRQESSSVKDDDLHQQIEDFLARFHENWRLQRQESLARYKKRLVELDE